MKVKARHEALVDLVNQEGYLSVDALANHFEVSPQTIRRDINELHKDNLVVRLHGGVGRSSSVENVNYSVRRVSLTEEKSLLGGMVADFLPDKASCFLAIGTTMEAVARCLLDREGMRIITNSIHVAEILHARRDFDVMIPGGTVKPNNGGIIGPACRDFLRNFRVDFAVMTVGAIESDGTMLDFDYNEVILARTMMQNARQTLIIADHTKFARTATVQLGNITDAHVLFTDKEPTSGLKDLLDLHNVQLVVPEQPVEEE